MPGPRLYAVVILNDDTTAFTDVIEVVKFVFGKTDDEAKDVAETVHTQGRCVMGKYLYEIAETKIDTIQELNELNNIKLQVIIDENYVDEDLRDLKDKLKPDSSK